MENQVRLGKRKRSNSPGSDPHSPSTSHTRNVSENCQKKSRGDVEHSENDEIIIMKEIITINDPEFDPNRPIYGSAYYCKDCEISMNGRQAYEDHICGKRHRKKVQSQIPAEVGQGFSKVPMRHASPQAVPVRNSDNVSVIQRAAESLRNPCPALDYIAEIRSFRKIHYSCNLCNSFCSLHKVLLHLNDFEHKLQCVKLYDFAAYRNIRSMHTSEAIKTLRKMLKNLIRRYGYGHIRVENRVLDTNDLFISNNKRGKTKDYSRRRFNYQDKDYRISEKFFDQNNLSECNTNSYTWLRSTYKESEYRSCNDNSSVPDLSKFDYYCRICDAHMNNKNMWEAHITGTKHIKKYKKKLGLFPSKLKSVLIPNARAKLMDQLDKITQPVVGLDAIQETYEADLSLYKYRCFLCGLFSTSRDIIDHILSFKHRNNFLEKIKYPPKNTLKEFNLPEFHKEILVIEMCAEVEAERGRGNIEVRTTDVSFQ